MNFPIAILLLTSAPVSVAAGQQKQAGGETPVTREEPRTVATTLPVSKSPIVCVDNLSAAELARRAELTGWLRKDIGEAEPIGQGYEVRFTSEKRLLELVEWIALERRCCPFLTFDLVFPPDGGEVVLRIVGGTGVKEFLATSFFPAKSP